MKNSYSRTHYKYFNEEKKMYVGIKRFRYERKKSKIKMWFWKILIGFATGRKGKWIRQLFYNMYYNME